MATTPADLLDTPVVAAERTVGVPDTTTLTPCDLPFQHALVADWLIDLDRRVAQGQRAGQTRLVYERAIRPWIRFLQQDARTDAPDPTTVMAFQAQSLARGLAPASINHRLATVCALYRFAERTGRYPHIARAAERLREHRDGPLPCLDHEQILALRASAREGVRLAEEARRQAAATNRCARHLLVARRNLAVLALLYGTGARLISLHRADCGDWHPGRGEWKHRPKGHVAADAVAYVGPAVTAELQAYLDARRSRAPTEPLFVSHAPGSDGHRLTVRMISRTVLEFLERAGHVTRGQNGAIADPRRLSAHSLRRSAAKRMVETHDLELARQLLGHASLETTRRAYARIQRSEELRRAAGDLDG
jgi:site-specific recombinase XerD